MVAGCMLMMAGCRLVAGHTRTTEGEGVAAKEIWDLYVGIAQKQGINIIQ